MTFEKGYALVIGVGSYTYLPNANIPISVTDARQFRDTLLDPNLCGYLPERVALLHDQQASRDNFLQALDNLATQTQKDPESTVIFFYCGHGDYSTDGDYCLSTWDTQLDGHRIAKGTGISERELLQKLQAISARRMLLLFNSCHSGEISPDLGFGGEAESFGSQSPPEKITSALLSTGEGRVIITASRPEQKSWIGNGALSIFTQALMDGLSGRGYVSNNHGYISAFDLYEHIYFAVKEAAGKLGKLQEPELTVLRGVGPFPISLYRGATDLGSFDPQEGEVSEEVAVRKIEPALSQRIFNKITDIDVSRKSTILVKGDVSHSTMIAGDGNILQQASGSNITQASAGPARVSETSHDTYFDQHGQLVGYQYNSAGEINFQTVQSREEAVTELRKLLVELELAAQAGVLEEEAATDVKYQVEKAVQQAKKPEPDKESILDYLANARKILFETSQTTVAATGLVATLAHAIQMIRLLF